MDRELPARIVRIRRVRRLIGVAAVVVVFAAAVWALRAVISPTLDRARIQTCLAEIGPVEATVSASGVVIPAFEQQLTSPINSTVQQVFVRNGDSVRSGQSILLLDTEALHNSRQQTENELEIHRTKKRQLTLALEKQKIDIESAYDIKNLQMQFAQAQYERQQHLYDIGGATEQDLERAALSVEIARRELTQLTRQLENQRQMLETDLNTVDLQIRIYENKLSEIARQLALAEARPERDGVVTWVRDDIGAAVQTGEVIARVADLRAFDVEASISDIHADKLAAGGAVKVRLGDRRLTGHIEAVRPSVQDGVVTFVVQLDDPANTVLRPNMRTDVFVVTSFVDSVVRVRNGSFYTGMRDQKVFVVEGDRAAAKTVDIGASNFDWVEVRGDIAPGDEVIISDMSKYRHMDEIAIKGELSSQ